MFSLKTNLFLIIFSLLLLGCQEPETSLEICDGDQCIPTNNGPGDPSNNDNTTIDSTSGYMSIKSFRNLSLDSSLTLYDVRTKDSTYYFYVQNKVSSSIYKYEVYQSDLSANNFELVCSFLSDNNFGRSFNFYNNDLVIESSSYTLSFRVFDIETCNEKSPINTGVYKGYSTNYSVGGARDDDLYFIKSGNLSVLAIDQNIITDDTESVSLGSVTSFFSSTKSLILKDNTLWAVIGTYIWKINLNDYSLGWAKLPTSTYKSLYNVLSITTHINSLYIFSEGDNDTIDVIEIDITNF